MLWGEGKEKNVIKSLKTRERLEIVLYDRSRPSEHTWHTSSMVPLLSASKLTLPTEYSCGTQSV